MGKGKLYNAIGMVTVASVRDGSYSEKIQELIDEAKRNFPEMCDDTFVWIWFERYFGDEK